MILVIPGVFWSSTEFMLFKNVFICMHLAIFQISKEGIS